MAHQKQNELILGRFKAKLIKRGAKGMIGLKKQFKIMDSDGSGALDYNEFKKALDDYRVGCTDPEVDQVFQIFDRNRDGTINFEEFIQAILGELNDFRVNLIHQAFKKLDENGNGVLELDEVKAKFDPSRHPDVQNRTKTVEECRYEFYEMFTTHHNVSQGFQPDKTVTIEEFIEYH